MKVEKIQLSLLNRQMTFSFCATNISSVLSKSISQVTIRNQVNDRRRVDAFREENGDIYIITFKR